jgi:hypothetical protein
MADRFIRKIIVSGWILIKKKGGFITRPDRIFIEFKLATAGSAAGTPA